MPAAAVAGLQTTWRRRLVSFVNPSRRRGVSRAWRTRIDELPAGLLDRLRRGQPEARAELFRRYAPRVRQILFLQGYCEELDDAVQDVFIKVYRAQLPPEETFLAWFYKLILNAGRDAGRRHKTRTSLAEKLEAAAPTLPAAAEAPHAADPALRAALADLAPELREVVALRFFADLPLEQIAASQDVPLGTVKSRLHTAMGRLRGSLTQRGIHGSTE
jgi:RNA polymerase sigma factor (sigma-70 family)